MALTHTIPRVVDSHVRTTCVVYQFICACLYVGMHEQVTFGFQRKYERLKSSISPFLFEAKGCQSCVWMHTGTFFSVASVLGAVFRLTLFPFIWHGLSCEVDLLIKAVGVSLVSKLTMLEGKSRTWITLLEKPFGTKRVGPHLCPRSLHALCVFGFLCLSFRCSNMPCNGTCIQMIKHKIGRRERIILCFFFFSTMERIDCALSHCM